MGKTKEEEHEGEAPITPNKPKDPKLQAAKVHMLNGTCKDFDVPRGSDGEILFSAVTKDLSIEEREYFSLCFYDEQGTRHWLYNDKKILRQLKGLPWEFSFEVKFYPTAPSTLNDDAARYHLFLQLRKDTTNGRLPATIPTHALLSALIAQAQYGDCDNSAEYERFLKDVAKIPNFGPTEKQEQLVNLNEKIKELHKEQKGLTASEAELKFLETCKKLSMYGVFVFDAIDNENGKVGIGICATGFNIYKETIRIHRFAWQNIVKISYRKAIFSIKLKAGELEKKEVTLHYKVSDHGYAKRLWRCGVEHHTFFRLIQPEEKQKAGVFRWGSSRFRYQGRTQFQTKMASQMFDSHGGTVPRANSARLAQSYDNGLNKETITIEEKCATMGEKLSSPLTSPGISYEINTKKTGRSTGKKGKKSKKSKGKHEPDSSDTSSSGDEDQHIKVVPVIEESGQPQTTVASWQETTVLPDNVTIEYDDQGNRITKTVKTSQVKHTVQKQTFQNYVVPDSSDPSSTVERTREQLTPLGSSSHAGPVVDTKTRSLVYESSAPVEAGAESLGEFVSSKTVTSGNRTIETITYKTEHDGIIETHVEHRVTINSEHPIDHDAELELALASATQMNPDMKVEKIEVRQESHS